MYSISLKHRGNSEVTQRDLKGVSETLFRKSGKTSLMTYKFTPPARLPGVGCLPLTAYTFGRKYLIWPAVFGGGFRVCEADAETGHKCHRRQARQGAAGGGRTKVDTGDSGHSATGTSIRIESPPYHPRSEMRRVFDCSEAKGKVSPLTALGRFGRLGANAERLSILERIKRSSIELIGVADTLLSGKAFLLTELAEEEVKTLRKARPIGLRLAIFFGLSANSSETTFNINTDIHSTHLQSATIAESPGLPDGLGGR